jgi:hypothetical protein
VGWFVICWGAFLLASMVAGALLLSLYRQSTTEQLRRASAAIAHGCDAIAARYQFFASSANGAPSDVHDPKFRRDLTGVIQVARRDLEGVAGGVWQTDGGSLAYAFPTYVGSGEKIDLPQAEESRIREAAETAARDGASFDRRKDGRSQTLLLRACPLPGAIPRLAGWTMARVPTIGPSGGHHSNRTSRGSRSANSSCP